MMNRTHLLSFQPPKTSFQTLRRKRGFTLVELLVVIAIIGVLVSLLLPAVQAAREAARRVSCLNKIRQIGLAAMNYESQYGYFPAAADYEGSIDYCAEDGGAVVVSPGGGPGTCESGAPWTVLLLPFLEQQPLYDLFSIESGFVSVLDIQTCKNNQSPTLLQQTPLSIWHCPSDPVIADEGNLATCYHACNGGGNPSFTNPNVDPNSNCQNEDCNVACRGSAWNNLEHFKNGIIYPTSNTKISEISDGTTNTIMFGENRLHFLPGMQPNPPGRFTGWASPSIMTNVHGCPVNVSAAAKSINETTNSSGRFIITTSVQGDRTHYWDADTSFSSNHPGGAHFAMGDSSGHFLSEDLDIEIYRSMGRRADGQPLSGELQ